MSEPITAGPLDLNDGDYVVWAIGMSAAKDVLIEGELREIWRVLTGVEGLGRFGVPSHRLALTKSVRTLVARSALSHGLKTLTSGVLEAVSKASRHRDILVHEQWTLAEPGKWKRGHDWEWDKQALPDWSRNDFDQVLRELTRASERARAIYWLIKVELENTTHRDDWIEVKIASDDFEMDDHTGRIVVRR